MSNNKGMLKISILSISFLLMLRLTISPALAEIGKAFPEISQGNLMNMVVVASLVAIPFGFISGILAMKMKKKTILYAGLVLYLVGGLGPMFASSFTVILVFRALLGAGTGLFLPFAAGLIADFFTGEERNKMIGYQSTAVALGNIVTSILAGVLATINWRFSFLIYAFAVITLLLVIIKLPEPERKVKAEGEGKTVNGRMMFVCGSIFIYAIIYFAFFGYLSFVIDAKQLGTAASTGLATMLMTVASIIMGIIFARFIRVLKNASLPIILIANVIGFYALSAATNFGMIIAGAIFIGIGFGLLMPYGTMKITDAAPPSAVTFANGLFMTFVNIGTAVSPTILVAVGNAFDNPDGQFIFLVCAVALGVGTLISIVLALGKRSPLPKA